MLAAASPRPGWGSSRRSLNAVGGWTAATAPHQLGKAECVSAFQRVRGVRASVVPFAERRRLAQHQRAGRPSGNARLGATRFAAEQGREGRKLRRDAEKTRRRRPPGSRRGAAGKLLQPRRLLRRRARDGGKPEPVRSPGGLRLLVPAGRAPVRLCRRRGARSCRVPRKGLHRGSRNRSPMRGPARRRRLVRSSRLREHYPSSGLWHLGKGLRLYRWSHECLLVDGGTGGRLGGATRRSWKAVGVVAEFCTRLGVRRPQVVVGRDVRSRRPYSLRQLERGGGTPVEIVLLLASIHWL